MTGTEMIDAIAHIDEDLIDGCLARMKARVSETVALHAKEAIREKTKKPLPAFAKAAIAFGALAAVLLLSFALISLLHIGGKSPTPIGPVSTHTPTPTEAGNEDGESPFRYSVAVVLDNEESLKFKTYGAEDFPEADAIEVVNVSEALEKSIRELVENGVNNEDVKEYNKCLRIVLKDPCEENASACASRLRERDHVVSAEPYLEPYDVTIEGLRCSIAETILNVVGKITVADRVFLYPRSFYIDVTNEEDGREYDLSYAYKNGMMTYDGLSELYRIHVEYMIRKFGYTEETYKKEAFVHYAFIGSCEIGFAHEETGEIEVKDVAGSKFIFVHPFTIVVQKIGEEDILDITEAYEAGLLTEEDVAEAARLHREFVISTFDFGEKLYEELAAEPTEAPTEAPKAAELDFDSCAELVLRLPWGNGEKEVFMQPASTDSLEEYIQVIPEHFNVIDGKVYIFDLFRPYGKGIIACDPETGNIERLSPDIGENALEDGEFAVMGGKLIFQNCMYDLSTGERTEIENALNRVLIMNVLDGKCIACNAVNAVDDDGQEFLFTQATFAYDVFELDMENLAWVQKERVEMPESVPHIEPPFSHYDLNVYSRGYTEVIGRDDGALFFFDRYMGTDNAGNHYVDSVEESADKNEGGGYTTIKTWRRIIKLSPEGVPVSYVDVSYPDNYLFSDWGNYLIFKVDGDGMVWYMCETKDEVLIYKIDLGNASAPDDTPEPTTASTEAPTPAPEIPEAGILTEVLRVGIGNADDQLGLDTSFEGIGPETFMIFDDSVAVLDSVKQRVCIFENGVLARTIDLAPANPDFYGYCMARLGDRLFVLNTFYGDDVYEFDYLTGEVLNSYPVPDGFQNNASCDLFVIDSVIYIGARSRSYELVPLCDPEAPGLRLIELSATESEVAWSTPYAPGTNTMEREADTFYHFINSDSYGNAYFRLFKMLPDMDGYICGENWLIRCAPTGEITGYAGIPNELCARLPHIDTVVLPDGRVYEMMCTETEVVIYEVTFGSAYESRTDELREFYRAKLGLD